MKKEKSKKTKPARKEVKPQKKKNEKKSTEEVKKEQWYIKFKKKLLEDEREYSKKYKRSRNLIALMAFICFLAVFLSTTFLDYSRAYNSKTAPFFVLQTKDEYKQATVYYGIFYKAWKCDYGKKSVEFGSYSSEISSCKIVINYDENNNYTNPNGIKMTREQINTIKTYFYDYFNEFKTKTEFNNAYKISTAINEVWWVQKNELITLADGSKAHTAIFNKLVNENGEYSWQLQYDDESYYKCVKPLEDDYVFAQYNPETEYKCGTEWTKLRLSDDICALSKTTIKYVKDLIRITNICD